MQDYDVSLHGDSLEKFASDFIKTRFANYELVWKTFIGNKGDQSKANIPKYLEDIKRQKFSEHSYTVLESIFISHRIVESGVFISRVNSWDSYFDFNTKFISFFTHIGRAHDNLIKASNLLKIENVNGIEQKLKEVYQARHIVVHGKTIPLTQDDLGLPQIPQFNTSDKFSFAWNDEHKLWNDANNIGYKSVKDTCKGYFDDILSIVDSTYGSFYKIIKEELNEIDTKIEFEYNAIRKDTIQKQQYVVVPSNSAGPPSLYNIQFPSAGSFQ